MSENELDHIACPSCHKRFGWKPGIARRKVRCAACGQAFQIPDQPGGAGRPLDPQAPPLSTQAPPASEEDEGAGEYELDDPDAVATPRARAAAAGPGTTLGERRAIAQGKCPACNKPIKPGAVICINCGFNLEEGRRVQTRIEKEQDAAPAPGSRTKPGGDPGSSSAGGGGSSSGGASSGGASSGGAPGGALAAALRRQGVDHEDAARQSHREHMWQTWYWPAIVAGVGLALLVLNTLVLAPAAFNIRPYSQFLGISAMEYSLYTLVYAVVRFVIQVPILFVGLLFLVMLLQTSFGPLLQALLKVTAIGLLSGAFYDSLFFLMDLLTGGFAFAGFIVQFTFSTAVFCVLCMWLLELDQMEMWVLWLFTVVAPFLVMSFLGVLLASLFT